MNGASPRRRAAAGVLVAGRRTATKTEPTISAAPSADRERQLLVEQQRAEQDRDERVDVLVRDDLRDRRVPQQPGVGGEADERAEDGEVEPGRDRLEREGAGSIVPSSPVAAPSTSRKTPALSISQVVATKPSRGQRQPVREEGAERPGDARAERDREPDRARGALAAGERRSARARPRPTSTLSRVASATRSRASVRSRITCSGTEPAIIAAMLESMRVSARVTTPTPRPSSASPRSADEASSRRVTRMLRPRSTRISASSAPASRKREPAERNAGSVRTEILIATYVEPQTR